MGCLRSRGESGLGHWKTVGKIGLGVLAGSGKHQWEGSGLEYGGKGRKTGGEQ